MFDKKYLTLFVGKASIVPGLVTMKNGVLFEEQETISYTSETLEGILTQIQSLSKRPVRVVLSEELVYVTSFLIPKTSKITREQVVQMAENSIPENLTGTAWDFQTLHYNQIHASETSTIVEVAVVTAPFAKLFAGALKTSSLSVECVIPESCALALLIAHLEGISLIVEASQGGALLVAAEKGAVWATYIKYGACEPADLEDFIKFVAKKNAAKIERVILSHGTEELALSLQPITSQYELLVENLNPLAGVALQKKITGKDEEVLNIDMFQTKTGFFPFRFRK